MNSLYDIIFLVIIMLGISFEIENKYDNYLCKILDGITSSFDNIMVNGEVFDKNGNSLFKKNRVLQARVLYFMLALSMTYLVTNFIWDFFTVSKIF